MRLIRNLVTHFCHQAVSHNIETQQSWKRIKRKIRL